MKIKNMALSALAVVSLCFCGKDDGPVSYTNDDVVIYNAQAALYFHTIFRETENAWAIVDSMEYDTAKPYEKKSGQSSTKTITYKGETKTITIEYNVWNTGGVQLIGSIIAIIPDKVYGQRDKTVSIMLTDNFSIAGQRVTGSASFTTGETADKYNFKLTEAAIYDRDETEGRTVLITAGITSGPYERVDGGGTVDQSDDIWKYTGTMTGTLFNDENIKYTNTIQDSYTVGDKTFDGSVYFSMDCKTAIQGISQVKTTGWPDIAYQYLCSGYDYLTVTGVDQ